MEISIFLHALSSIPTGQPLTNEFSHQLAVRQPFAKLLWTLAITIIITNVTSRKLKSWRKNSTNGSVAEWVSIVSALTASVVMLCCTALSHACISTKLFVRSTYSTLLAAYDSSIQSHTTQIINITVGCANKQLQQFQILKW